MKSYMYVIVTVVKRNGDFRKLWIARINAAARLNGIATATMHGLNWYSTQLFSQY